MIYGFRPSPPDAKDYVADPAGLTVLPEVDMRASCMPLVYDQGQLGSCTANAGAAALQRDLSLDRKLQGLGPARRQSRLDIYYGERALEGELGQGDTGAYGRDAFKFAQQTGVLLERVWPYTMLPDGTVEGWEGPPPTGYKRHVLAKPYAHPAQDKDTVKAVLSNDQIIIYGFTVYSSFESGQVAANGMVPMPARGEQELGGHEVCAVGYLQAYPDHVLCRNSWGSGWGISGYFMMPWSYILDTGLCSDLRTIVRAA